MKIYSLAKIKINNPKIMIKTNRNKIKNQNNHQNSPIPTQIMIQIRKRIL